MMQDVGFRADRVLTAQTTLPSARYDTQAKRLQFWRDLFERLESMPGVTAAGGSTALPFSNWEWQTDFRIVGREDVPNDGTSIRTVHPGYFGTLRVPLLSGRTFTDADTPASEGAIVVNEAFARHHMAGLDPVGQRLRFTRETGAAPVQIIGVVGNTRHVRLHEDAKPEVYRPLAQEPPHTLVMAIRTSGDPRGAVSLLRGAIRELDRDLPVEQLMTMDALIGRTVAERRFYLMLMAFFAGVAVLLAVVGIYGVMAQAVGQRTREIGIRMALGAAPAQVQRMVLRSGAVLIGSGLLLGLTGALATSSVLRSQLFGVTPRDPLTLMAVIGILGALGLLATYVPARRARLLDPIAALRRE
jgi:predicted permease